MKYNSLFDFREIVPSNLKSFNCHRLKTSFYECPFAVTTATTIIINILSFNLRYFFHHFLFAFWERKMIMRYGEIRGKNWNGIDFIPWRSRRITLIVTKLNYHWKKHQTDWMGKYVFRIRIYKTFNPNSINRLQFRVFLGQPRTSHTSTRRVYVHTMDMKHIFFYFFHVPNSMYIYKMGNKTKSVKSIGKLFLSFSYSFFVPPTSDPT